MRLSLGQLRPFLPISPPPGGLLRQVSEITVSPFWGRGAPWGKKGADGAGGKMLHTLRAGRFSRTLRESRTAIAAAWGLGVDMGEMGRGEEV